MTPGASAYFTAAEPGLDPALFSGTSSLRPEVGAYILGHLHGFFRELGITPGTWLHAWLAGSGVSYQWKASRGNGDLDVLLGVDAARFTAANPEFAAGARQQLAGIINDRMKAALWPLTAAAAFGGELYEVTYYWNPDVSDDIRVIRPYAAWSLDASRWDVPPDPDPPRGSFPPEWYDRVHADTARVLGLYQDWMQHLADVQFFPASSPNRTNAEAAYRRLTTELRSTWDVLHDGRRSAFTGSGQGWADWHNFRWQAAKASGTAGLLRDVIKTDDQHQAETGTALYGAPVEPGEIAMRRAAAAYSRWAT